MRMDATIGPNAKGRMSPADAFGYIKPPTKNVGGFFLGKKKGRTLRDPTTLQKLHTCINPWPTTKSGGSNNSRTICRFWSNARRRSGFPRTL